jgi:hypothetical protein
MQAHLSGIMKLMRLLESAAGKPFEEYGNLSDSNVSFKRHRHPLERNTVKRTTAPDKSTEAQVDVPAQQPDNAKHISKGFANNRTARQAAAHVQQCLVSQIFPASGMCQGLQASAVAQPAVTQRHTRVMVHYLCSHSRPRHCSPPYSSRLQRNVRTVYMSLVHMCGNSVHGMEVSS